MIDFQEIQEGEIIKVLVNNEDVEEELYARVYKVHGNNILQVKYLVPTEKLWKGACVYELEDTLESVEPESICEHYAGVILFDELEHIKKIPRTPYYYFVDEKDEDESDDEVMSADEEDGYEIDGEFCVDDHVIDGRVELPPDHREVDQAWNDWQPTTTGAKRFKERVDLIEQLARQHIDTLNF
jgi:hypothetical protein